MQRTGPDPRRTHAEDARPLKPELLRLLELLSPTDRRVLAQLWAAPTPEPAVLLALMTDAERMAAQWARLSEREQAALTRLLADRGAVPVGVLQREFGGVREPGGFEHPRAYLQALSSPATPTERLYNMGLIFKAHDQRGAIYRIPNDLLPVLRAVLGDVPPRDRRLRVPPASDTVEIAAPAPSAEELVTLLLTLAYHGELRALDDGALNKASLVTLARQLPDSPEMRGLRREADWPLVTFVRAAAVGADLLRRSGDGELRPTARALDWLKAPQRERVLALLDGWCASALDDLTLLCGLRWQGGAPYTLNRTAARRGLLSLLGTLPGAIWLDVDAIIGAVYQVEPDFQRRDGRYDTWLLYTNRDQLVGGWEHWHAVEGALIRAVLCGPLCWLGLAECSSGGRVRITPLGAHLLADPEVQPVPAPPEPAATPLIVQGTFEVLCPPGASCYARFQLSRVAELHQSGTVSVYRLTRAALLAATERGIDADDVIAFLADASAGPLPPAVAYTLRDWGGQAAQVRLEHAVLLHAADPVVMARLRAGRSIALGDAEQLTPTVARVPDGAADELAERLRRAGFGLRDERVDPALPIDERELRALVTAACVSVRICAELALPSDISPTMLQRLLKLVPPRQAEQAQRVAEDVAQRLARQRTAGGSDDAEAV